MLDVDNFKKYNDTYGHQAGDKVLIAISQAISEKLKRAGDDYYRIGGEEFAVLFNSENQLLALKFVESLRESIVQLKIKHCGNTCFDYVSASFGLVSLSANKIECGENLYKQCDELLYKAKHEGRNRVCANF